MGTSNVSRLVTFTRRVPSSPSMIADDPVDVADLGLALGHARLEELLDARQAGGDVHAGDAAGVERPHRQLRAGLADGLGGDDADRLADADELAGREVAAVAGPADAVRDWHVSGDRTSTSSMPASSMAARELLGDLLAPLDDGRVLLLALRCDDRAGGEAADEPTREGVAAEPRTPRSRSSVIQVPSSVPQSSSRVMTSCATSTRRRVR